jgi:anti-sigma regulatory factor (Ser/Thr protein kinase)
VPERHHLDIPAQRRSSAGFVAPSTATDKASRPGTGPPAVWRSGTANLTLAASGRSVAAVRAWAASRLAGRAVPEEAAELATLLMSELVGNVLRHTDSPRLIVRLATGGDVTVAVHDEAVDRVPVVRNCGLMDEGGRGLALVDLLAQEWGVQTSPAGKWVWFRLVPGAPEAG